MALKRKQWLYSSFFFLLLLTSAICFPVMRISILIVLFTEKNWNNTAVSININFVGYKVCIAKATISQSTTNVSTVNPIESVSQIVKSSIYEQYDFFNHRRRIYLFYFLSIGAHTDFIRFFLDSWWNHQRWIRDVCRRAKTEFGISLQACLYSLQIVVQLLQRTLLISNDPEAVILLRTFQKPCRRKQLQRRSILPLSLRYSQHCPQQSQ